MAPGGAPAFHGEHSRIDHYHSPREHRTFSVWNPKEFLPITVNSTELRWTRVCVRVGTRQFAVFLYQLHALQICSTSVVVFLSKHGCVAGG